MYSQTIATNISFQNLFHPRIFMVTKAFESKLIGFVRQNSIYVCGLRAIRSTGRVFWPILNWIQPNHKASHMKSHYNDQFCLSGKQATASLLDRILTHTLAPIVRAGCARVQLHHEVNFPVTEMTRPDPSLAFQLGPNWFGCSTLPLGVLHPNNGLAPLKCART